LGLVIYIRGMSGVVLVSEPNSEEQLAS
jgi:hypothetical protein